MINKTSLRQSMLAQRNALTEQQQAQAAQKFTVKALDYLKTKNYKTIAGYYPFRGELNLLPLLAELEEMGKTVLLPRTPDKPAPLTFYHYNKNALETGRYGITQPKDNGLTYIPDIILVPLVAFDANHNRLGYGGGYYDRTLASLKPRPISIGCAYEFQRVEALKAEAHDELLDMIITL